MSKSDKITKSGKRISCLLSQIPDVELREKLRLEIVLFAHIAFKKEVVITEKSFVNRILDEVL